MNAISHKMEGRDWALLVLLSMIWGGSFLFMEIAINDFPTLTIVAIRVTLAALALNSFLLVMGQRLRYPPKIWKSFIIMAIFGNVIPFSLIVWGQIYITAGLSSILNGTVPFFTVLAAHYFTHDEKFAFNKIVGLFVGFAGVITIIGPGALVDSHHVMGELAVLTAAACYAVAIIYAKRFPSLGVPSIHAATGQLTSSALILIPLSLLIEKPWLTATPHFESMAALTALGVMSTGIALTMYYYLLNKVGATNTSLVTFLIPVSAIFLGVIFLGESLSVNQVAGMGLICVGLLTMNGQFNALLKPRQI